MSSSGLVCLAPSSMNGLDMSHILFMVFIFLLSCYHRDLHSFPTRRSSDLPTPSTRAAKLFAQWNRVDGADPVPLGDRKSTRLNSSHSQISYAVFCLKKKNWHVRQGPA